MISSSRMFDGFGGSVCRESISKFNNKRKPIIQLITGLK
jgi:hypothetical protein